jgi:hypothetical protein
MKKEKDSTIRAYPAEPTTTINGLVIRAGLFLLNANKTGTRELQLWIDTLFGWEMMERRVRTMIDEYEVGGGRWWRDMNKI